MHHHVAYSPLLLNTAYHLGFTINENVSTNNYNILNASLLPDIIPRRRTQSVWPVTTYHQNSHQSSPAVAQNVSPTTSHQLTWGSGQPGWSRGTLGLSHTSFTAITKWIVKWVLLVWMNNFPRIYHYQSRIVILVPSHIKWHFHHSLQMQQHLTHYSLSMDIDIE